jgi:serine/threonine protein kinase
VYQALKGGTTLSTFIKFFGFTRIPVYRDINQICSLPYEDQVDIRLTLVFDYASGGTLLEYLQNSLQPGKPYHSWGEVRGCLLDVARGLEEIHKRSIVHRSEERISPKIFHEG